MTPSYADARSFRRALEDRLKREASAQGVALDRLRKQVAHERFLARLVHTAPADSWALKGGLALIARLGLKARATKDADATWRRDPGALDELLDEVLDCELDDFFSFEIGTPRPLEAEGPAGGRRYSVVARVDGRVFENLKLDINVVVGDPRAIESVTLSSLLKFAGFDTVKVPMIRVDQHLAEKIHAYCREYGGRPSGRAKDLFDMLRIAEYSLAGDATSLRAACLETFAIRNTQWPPVMPTPPAEWAGAWADYVAEYGISSKTLDEAFSQLRAFWRPIMRNDPPRGEWLPHEWAWSGDRQR